MNQSMPSPTRMVDAVLNIGAPLLAIAALSVHNNIPIGAVCTIWAAVIAGAMVPVFNRFVGKPFLAACGIPVPSITSYVFLAACNALVGALSALATLPG